MTKEEKDLLESNIGTDDISLEDMRECERILDEIPTWHDLRENPQDLPRDFVSCAVVYLNHEPEPYHPEIKDVPQVGAAIFCEGKWWWWSCVCEDYLREGGYSFRDKIDEAIEVIAWMQFPDLPKGVE